MLDTQGNRNHNQRQKTMILKDVFHNNIRNMKVTRNKGKSYYLWRLCLTWSEALQRGQVGCAVSHKFKHSE